MEKNWKKFTTACLNECFYKNTFNDKNNVPKIYTLSYDYDEIEIIFSKKVNDIERQLLSSITVNREEYEAGTADDKKIISNMFASIHKNAKK